MKSSPFGFSLVLFLFAIVSWSLYSTSSVELRLDKYDNRACHKNGGDWQSGTCLVLSPSKVTGPHGPRGDYGYRCFHDSELTSADGSLAFSKTWRLPSQAHLSFSEATTRKNAMKEKACKEYQARHSTGQAYPCFYNPKSLSETAWRCPSEGFEKISKARAEQTFLWSLVSTGLFICLLGSICAWMALAPSFQRSCLRNGEVQETAELEVSEMPGSPMSL